MRDETTYRKNYPVGLINTFIIFWTFNTHVTVDTSVLIIMRTTLQHRAVLITFPLIMQKAINADIGRNSRRGVGA